MQFDRPVCVERFSASGTASLKTRGVIPAVMFIQPGRARSRVSAVMRHGIRAAQNPVRHVKYPFLRPGLHVNAELSGFSPWSRSGVQGGSRNTEINITVNVGGVNEVSRSRREHALIRRRRRSADRRCQEDSELPIAAGKRGAALLQGVSGRQRSRKPAWNFRYRQRRESSYTTE